MMKLSNDAFLVVVEKEVDKIEQQVKETMESDYEASFPGVDK